MKIISWEDFVGAPGSPDYAVSIGVFDGVHLGHVRLLESILAKKPGMAAAAVTFSQNPKKLLHPQGFKGNVFTLGQKLEAFAVLGLDACVLIDFSPDFGTLSGAEFLSGLARGGVKFICVGPNFRCGHKMDTNAQAMAQIASGLGMKTEIVEPVMHAGHPVSSSRIRNSILEGKLAEARRMLGRPHFLKVSKVIREKGGTCALAFEDDAVLPPMGGYLVSVDGGEPRVATLTEERRLNVELPMDDAVSVAFNEIVSIA